MKRFTQLVLSAVTLAALFAVPGVAHADPYGRDRDRHDWEHDGRGRHDWDRRAAWHDHDRFHGPRWWWGYAPRPVVYYPAPPVQIVRPAPVVVVQQPPVTTSYWYVETR